MRAPAWFDCSLIRGLGLAHEAWSRRAVRMPRVEAGSRCVIDKTIGLLRGMDHSKESHPSKGRAEKVEEAVALGWSAALQDHMMAWERIWERSDVTITGDDAAQQAIRFNIFHLNQTFTGDDPRLNIGPRDLPARSTVAQATGTPRRIACLSISAPIHKSVRGNCSSTAAITWTGPLKTRPNWASMAAPPCTPWSP